VDVLPNPWAGTPLPAADGRWTASGGRWLVGLGPNESSSIKVTVTAPPGATGDNQLTVKAASAASPAMSDTAAVRLTAGSADLAVALSAPATLTFGSPLKYRATVTNRGPNDAREVRVSQQLPAGAALQSAAMAGGSCVLASPVVCSLPLLAANASAYLDVTVLPAAPGTVSSTAQVVGLLLDPASFNDTASAVTQVQAKPVIAAAVAQKGAGWVTVRFTNTGTAAAQRVTLDQLTARTTLGTGAVSIIAPGLPVSIGTLAPGEYRDVTIFYAAPATVKGISITEGGSFADPLGAAYRFALAQGVTL